MPSGLSPLKLGSPKLPPIPYQGKAPFFEWVHKFYVELEIYYNKMKNQLVDNRGFLQVDTQEATNGFSVIPSANYIDLKPPILTPVVSSATAAVARGVEGQGLILTNVGDANVTIKHGAQTFLASGADAVIPPLHSIFLRWDSTSNLWTQIVTI